MAAQTTDSDVTDLRTRLREALDDSQLTETLRTLRESVATSRMWALGERTAEVTKNAYLYRWLTKEPDPDVIVIDLRETYTVGPLIHLLDRLVERLTPYWRDSTLKRGLDGLAALGERAADTRPGRILATLLEPPEPPDRSDELDGGADRPANSHDE